MPSKTKCDPVCNTIKPLPPCPRSRPIFFAEPSRTRQEFKDECDINNIMEKYQRTGVVNHINKYEPQYGDCPNVSFQEAIEIVRNGETMFSELPSKIRAHFDNSPEGFLDFVTDEKNREEAVLMGLIEEPKEAPEAPVPPPQSPPPGGDD